MLGAGGSRRDGHRTHLDTCRQQHPLLPCIWLGSAWGQRHTGPVDCWPRGKEGGVCGLPRQRRGRLRHGAEEAHSTRLAVGGAWHACCACTLHSVTAGAQRHQHGALTCSFHGIRRHQPQQRRSPVQPPCRRAWPPAMGAMAAPPPLGTGVLCAGPGRQERAPALAHSQLSSVSSEGAGPRSLLVASCFYYSICSGDLGGLGATQEAAQRLGQWYYCCVCADEKRE